MAVKRELNSCAVGTVDDGGTSAMVQNRTTDNKMTLS